MYDANEKQVSDIRQAMYYRRINYSKGKPAGLVRDYYLSGKIQSEKTFKNGKMDGNPFFGICLLGDFNLNSTSILNPDLKNLT